MVTIRQTSWSDPAGEGDGLGELHDGNIRVKCVGVPGRVLNCSRYPDIHRAPSVTAGADVVVAQPYMARAGTSGGRIKTMSSSEDGVLIEKCSTTHHLEPTEPQSAHNNSPGPGTGLSLRPSNNPVIISQPAI